MIHYDKGGIFYELVSPGRVLITSKSSMETKYSQLGSSKLDGLMQAARCPRLMNHIKCKGSSVTVAARPSDLFLDAQFVETSHLAVAPAPTSP